MKYVLLLSFMIFACGTASAHGQEKNLSSGQRAALEKQLFEIEQQWLQAEHDKNMDVLRDLWRDQFFDVLAGGILVNKQEMMDRLAKADAKPGTGAFPDDFKLRAVYGNVALATDHTIIKGLDAHGNLFVVREMRVLRVFVKDKGKWKVAGAGLVPIVAP
jgi:ketosteroid isomerase-like protein